MDDIAESYAFESIEQVRAMADELRIRIVDQLVIQPMTVTQVGEALGVHPNKIHYHVRELERAGLVRLVETREKSGILEKYYRPVARNFNVPDDLLRTTPPDEIISAVHEFLQVVNQSLLDALRRDIDHGVAGGEVTGLSATSYFATNAEAKELDSQIRKVLDPYVHPRGLEGEREHRLVYFSYALPPSEANAAPNKAVAVEDAQKASLQIQVDTPASAGPLVQTLPPTHRPKRRRIFVAGALTYTRADLEQVVAAGEQLDIRVFGSCAFAEDITAELVELALVRFRHRGVLQASDAIQRVLKTKEES